MTIGAILIQPIRVDDAVRWRQFRAGKMMIDDDHIHAGFSHGGKWRMRVDPAIDSHNQPGTAFL